MTQLKVHYQSKLNHKLGIALAECGRATARLTRQPKEITCQRCSYLYNRNYASLGYLDATCRNLPPGPAGPETAGRRF